MSESETPQKAHDIDKSDPDYQIKVSEVLRRRFEEEKKKSFDREKNKMDDGRKKVSNETGPTRNEVNPDRPTTPPDQNTDSVASDIRNPDDLVRRKDIVALVNSINQSFAIIEKHRLKVEEFMSTLKGVLNK